MVNIALERAASETDIKDKVGFISTCRSVSSVSNDLVFLTSWFYVSD